MRNQGLPSSIAIVGMDCNFPGGIDSPEKFWDLIVDEQYVSTPLPSDRGWDTKNLFNPDQSVEGSTYIERGAFLEDAAGFDEEFFGIGPREAVSMDPQQRLLLECSWRALERARISPGSLKGTRTGVYVGMFPNGYDTLALSGPTGLEGYLATGGLLSMGAGRVAYHLGLSGPAITLDTACSSGLVALHVAVQALRAGECDIALAEAAMVVGHPSVLTRGSKLGTFASDGRSKPFAAEADGFCFAEGCAALVLMSLERAREFGSPVLAVVRGTALNEDGASDRLTTTNGAAQRAVIAAALQDAGLRADQIDVVETHGPGTPVGDPVEVEALQDGYGRHRTADKPLLIGSVKSNIGHMQATAGLAGVMKMVLSLQHGRIPASLHADNLTPEVDWTAAPVELVRRTRNWPCGPEPRRAGVLAYGLSGTNAHVLLEEAPVQATAPPASSCPAEQAGPVGTRTVALVSGASPAALRAQAVRLAEHLRKVGSEQALADVVYSLAAQRTALAHRAAVLCSDTNQLLGGLDALAQETPSSDVLMGRAVPGEQPVFVFPGQGAQWLEMGAELLKTDEVFAETMRSCAQSLRPYVDFDVLDAVRGLLNPAELERAEVIQPALFSMYVSLAQMWVARGITPAAVIGHSQGEIAAAYMAGALTLEQAAQVVALRSRSLRSVTTPGAMASLALSAAATTELLQRWQGRIEVAVNNSSAATVVAGDLEAVQELLKACEQDGIWVRLLPVDYASHSHHMDAAREQILQALDDLTPCAARVPVISATTGAEIDTTTMGAEYWFNNLRHTVNFEQAVQCAVAAGHRQFIEISPHPVLVGVIKDILADADVSGSVSGTLSRQAGGSDAFIAALAQAWAGGVAVNWTEIHKGNLVDLPVYAFQHRRHWLPTTPSQGDVSGAGLTSLAHPLLSAAVELPDGGVVLTGTVSSLTSPWLSDHALRGTALMPGTCMFEFLLQAAGYLGSSHLDDVTLYAPLVVTGDTFDLRVHAEPADTSGRSRISLHSRPQDSQEPWTQHADAFCVQGADIPPPAAPSAWPPEGTTEVDVAEYYQRLKSAGYEYGAAFRGLSRMWNSPTATYAEIILPDGLREGVDSYLVHPALLDAALHPALVPGDAGDREDLCLVQACSSLQVFARGATTLHIVLKGVGTGIVRVEATDANGDLVALIEDLEFSATSPEDVMELLAPTGSHEFTVSWTPLPSTPPAGAAAPAEWMSVGPRQTLPAMPHYGTLNDVRQALPQAASVPEVLVVDCRGARSCLLSDTLPPQEEVEETLQWLLRQLQEALAEPALDNTQLVILTRHAQLVMPGQLERDPTGAACAGMARSVASEYPGRVRIIDTDTPTWDGLWAAVNAPEREVALRDGQLFAARFERLRAEELLHLPPAGEPWQLVTGHEPTMQAVHAETGVPADAPLTGNQVRIRVDATGLNFRDSMIALGLLPDRSLGCEVAGQVIETGPDVISPRVGDAVMALVPDGGGFAPTCVTAAHCVLPIPPGWTPAQAAAAPVAYLTAHTALLRAASLKPGERVLIHAAAGGTGMAALQVAAMTDTEIYATASIPKHPLVQSLGVPRSRIANSRDLSFEDELRQATDGQGFDVIIGSLAGPFVDASMRLLAPGGRYVELGKTDPRDPQQMRDAYPDRTYILFNLLEVDAEDIDIGSLSERFAAGHLPPLPLQSHDIRKIRNVLRDLAQGHTTGKNVVTPPVALDPDGTALITGGTGTLGRLLAKHLVTTHKIRHLLLTSRSGSSATGAQALCDELAQLGAQVSIVACDTSDRAALRRTLQGIDHNHPLTAVIHAAGVLKDAAFCDLTPAQLHAVLDAKAAGALNLHDLTKDQPVRAFVLYSSVAGMLGTAGQANYAAANTFIDALAEHRRSIGLPATSIAWGLWEQDSGLTAALTDVHRHRLTRLGISPVSTHRAHTGFDRAIQSDRAILTIAHLRAAKASDRIPPLLASAVKKHRRPIALPKAEKATPTTDERAQLTSLSGEDRRRHLLRTVRAHAATVLGHNTPDAVDPDTALRDIGFDSLATVELRTRLNRALGTSLTAAAIYQNPTPAKLTAHLAGLLDQEATSTAPRPEDPADHDSSVLACFAHTFRTEGTEAARHYLENVAQQRPVFTAPSAQHPAKLTQLSEGTQSPGIICVPPLTAPTGVEAYAPLAHGFQSQHSLWVLSCPGYREGEALPASLEVLLDTWTETVAEVARTTPITLLGHSSGGWGANSLARHLHNADIPLHGVVLLDTFPDPAVVSTINDTVAARIASKNAALFYDDSLLTAIGAYMHLFRSWKPQVPGVPVLYIRPETGGQPEPWPLDHTGASTPGDHFTMIETHAEKCAQAITAWFDQHPAS